MLQMTKSVITSLSNAASRSNNDSIQGTDSRHDSHRFSTLEERIDRHTQRHIQNIQEDGNVRCTGIKNTRNVRSCVKPIKIMVVFKKHTRDTIRRLSTSPRWCIDRVPKTQSLVYTCENVRTDLQEYGTRKTPGARTYKPHFFFMRNCRNWSLDMFPPLLPLLLLDFPLLVSSSSSVIFVSVVGSFGVGRLLRLMAPPPRRER